jgi:hypothetical protein
MPAWIAGIQIRRMRPETSMSTWVPAIHAGTTNVCRNVDLHKAAGRKRSVHPPNSNTAQGPDAIIFHSL